MASTSRFHVGTIALLGTLLSTSALAADCPLSREQLRNEALDVLRTRFPTRTFEPMASPDVIRSGKAELGLQNLRDRLCVSPPANAAARREELVAYFDRMVPTLDGEPAQIPRTWAEARRRVRLQFLPEGYLRSVAEDKALAFRPFVPGAHLAAVVDLPSGYVYVRNEDRKRWGVGEAALFETALKNLDQAFKAAKLQGAEPPDPFLASAEHDGYDAVRLLVPWVRQEAAKRLGDPFFAAIPNRDFLVMWSTRNSAPFQARARENVARDHAEQPYKLSPDILRVWANGRVEVATP